MSMQPGDAGRLAHEIDEAERKAQAELATHTFEVASGKPDDDPDDDNGEAGTILGRATW